MQVRPDWETTLVPASVIEIKTGTKFVGPGLYLTETDTMLIVPVPPTAVPTLETVWADAQPLGTLYDVAVWNARIDQTILRAVATCPTRLDARENPGA